MTQYRVTLHSGLSTIIEAKDEEELMKKIRSGKHGILPLRSRYSVRITESAVDVIDELHDE